MLKQVAVSSSNPHDSLVKSVFSDPEIAAGELRAVLPQEVSSRLAWDTLHLEPGSFVDPEFRDRHTDLLFSADVRGRSGRRALVYVLLEHQSSPDPWMPLRLLRYIVRVWDAFLVAHPATDRLPAVIPMVLAHGDRRWNVPTEFVDLVDIDDDAKAAVAPFIPSFRYALDDLARVTDEELLTRAINAYGRLALFFLQRARTGRDFIGRFLFWKSAIAELLAQPNGRASLVTLLRYHWLVAEEPGPEEIRQALENAAGPEAKEAFVTIAEMLKAEGRVEGEARGRAQAVVDLLEDRQIAVSDEMRARVLACRDVALLRSWLIRAATVRTAEELFTS